MTHPSQVIVVVTIVGVDDNAQVFYTYTDDELNHVHIEDPWSDVRAVIPYHTLYVLDYASSRNGWRFKRHLVWMGRPHTEHWRTDNKLGMITVHDDRKVHRFKLKFHNRVTGYDVKDDPQEANVKEPT
ncbi:MAG TPA: hypothetical protein VF774_03040 [Pseudoduganella sp.]